MLHHPLDFTLLPADWLGKSENTDPFCDAYNFIAGCNFTEV